MTLVDPHCYSNGTYDVTRKRAVEATQLRKISEALAAWGELLESIYATEGDFFSFGQSVLEAGLLDKTADLIRSSSLLELGRRRFPLNMWISRQWALAAKWQNDFIEAARRFSEIRETFDTDIFASEHAECLSNAGRSEEAALIISTALKKFPSSRWVHLSSVRIASRQGLVAEVERQWIDILARFGDADENGAFQLDRHLLLEKVKTLLDVGAYRAAMEPVATLATTLREDSLCLGPSVPGVILSRQPLIVISASYSFDTLVIPIMEFRQNCQEPAFFFFGSNMSLVFHTELRERLSKQFVDLTARYKNARIIFMANEVQELILARSLGMKAELVNNNAFIDTALYNINPSEIRLYDAVYNARFMPYKRHYLAAMVASLRLIAAAPKDISHHEVAHGIRELFPEAKINDVELSNQEVCSALNSARCGLCLSAAEGAMYAAIEYLLCGLPIVTTKNIGGRDWWLNDDYTIWCADDPAAVAAAVREIIQRDLSPYRIREEALQRIDRERQYLFSIISRELFVSNCKIPNLENAFSKRMSDRANYKTRPLTYFLISDEVETCRV